MLCPARATWILLLSGAARRPPSSRAWATDPRQRSSPLPASCVEVPHAALIQQILLLQLDSVRPATLRCSRLPDTSAPSSLSFASHLSDESALIEVPGGSIAIDVAAIGVPRRSGLLLAYHQAVDGSGRGEAMRRIDIAELALDGANLGSVDLTPCPPVVVPHASCADELSHLAWAADGRDGDALTLVTVAHDDAGSTVNSWRFDHVAASLSEGFAGLGSLQNAPSLPPPAWSSQLRSATTLPRIRAASARIPSRPGVVMAIVSATSDETASVEAICLDAATLEPIGLVAATRFPSRAVGRDIAHSPNGAFLATGLAMVAAPLVVGGSELALAVLRRASALDIASVLQVRGGAAEAAAGMWTALADLLGPRPRPDRTWACIDLLRAQYAVLSLDKASSAQAAVVRTILALHASHATFASAMAQLRGGDERTFNMRA